MCVCVCVCSCIYTRSHRLFSIYTIHLHKQYTRIYVLRFDINHTFLLHNFILLSVCCVFFLRILDRGHFYPPKMALEMYLDWDQVKEMISVWYGVRCIRAYLGCVKVCVRCQSFHCPNLWAKRIHAHTHTHEFSIGKLNIKGIQAMSVNTFIRYRCGLGGWRVIESDKQSNILEKIAKLPRIRNIERSCTLRIRTLSFNCQVLSTQDDIISLIFYFQLFAFIWIGRIEVSELKIR